jgi:hypothetical protein
MERCLSRVRPCTTCGKHSCPTGMQCLAPSVAHRAATPWNRLGTTDMGLGGRPGRYLRPAPKRPAPNRRTPTVSLLTRRFLVLGCGCCSCCVSFLHAPVHAPLGWRLVASTTGAGSLTDPNKVPREQGRLVDRDLRFMVRSFRCPRHMGPDVAGLAASGFRDW